MHHLSPFIFYFIFIVVLSCVLSAKEADTLRTNVEGVIKAILVEKYNGTNGAVDKNQLKALIDATVGESRAEDSVVIQDIVTPCSERENLTGCFDVISKTCLDGDIISTIYAGNESSDWTDVFPALVYHHVSGACSIADDGEDIHKKDEKPSSATAWAYGLGFAFLVVLISNIGGCLVPFRKRKFFHRMLMFCVALAVGTLAGTGFLVLIPESMHLTGEDSPVPGYHFKMSTALAGIYFFYVSERALKTFMRRKKKDKITDKEMTLMPPKEVELPALANGDANAELTNDDEDADFTALDVRKGRDANAKKVNSVAWLVLVGDALHNFVDGMSIGAAFTENVYTGISVSLAVLCEELPHELGDIAILHHAGLSMKKALLYNFGAALLILVGLVLGILLGENTEANAWIFASAGGMFIYISLVDILPEMSEQARNVVEKGIETPTATFIIQNLGLIIGFTIIFLLAMFGKYIQV